MYYKLTGQKWAENVLLKITVLEAVLLHSKSNIISVSVKFYNTEYSKKKYFGH